MIKYSKFKELVDSLLYFEPGYRFDEDDYVELYLDLKENRPHYDPKYYIEQRFEGFEKNGLNVWFKSAKISGSDITELYEDQVFVFGSNMRGIHGAGAARLAKLKFGAIEGRWTGLNGQSYAIPTKDRYIHTMSIEEIEYYVVKFIEFAAKKKDLTFLVTEIGCGLAGYEIEDIAPLFESAIGVYNIWLPFKFKDFIEKRELESRNRAIKSMII